MSDERRRNLYGDYKPSYHMEVWHHQVVARVSQEFNEEPVVFDLRLERRPLQ